MISNYLKIGIRNLLKHKLFSFITIAGMAISIASCLLISIYVWDELSFDNYHPDADRTFRIYNIRTGDDGVTSYLPIVPPTFGPTLQNDYPEVESTLRILDTYGAKLFEYEGEKIKESKGIYAEPTVFDMLTIHLKYGDQNSALNKANTVVLSALLSKKYFGDKNPVGEVIKISDYDFQVTGVFDELPINSHLQVNYIMSFATFSQFISSERIESWSWQQFFTYVKLKQGTSANQFEGKLDDFAKKYGHPVTKPSGFVYTPRIQNIKDIHLHSSNFEWEIAQRGNAQSIYVLSGTAIFILLIASLNFINLSTARSIKRMKEVGIRKVAGAFRFQLITQFISESVIITSMGFLIAIGIAQMAFPYLNEFTGKSIASPFSLEFTLGIMAFVLILGTLAGSYPAFQLSRFRPAAAIYNRNSAKKETVFYRNTLVVLQFMFSFFLITGSMIVLSQNNLLHNKDLGFNKDQLMVLDLNKAALPNFEAIKQGFLSNSNITHATVGYGLPGDIVAGDGVTDPTMNKELPTNMFCVDFDYVKTLGLEIIAGRDFSKDFGTDTKRGFILNETAVKVFGFGTPEEAIGHPLNWDMWKKWEGDTIKRGEVIGVVKDFHFKSLREQLSPVVLQIFPPAYFTLTLKIKPEDMASTIAFCKATYEKLIPDIPFSYKFLDSNFEAMYKSEEKLSVFFTIFSGLAILVACMGLFGLVEYSVNQRVREIGIRKVFGASVNSLVLLLTRKYFGLILIAFVIIIPISYYAASQWLSTFAYRIDISPLIYLKACLLIALITLLTVSIQSIKAALTNPTSTLKE
ncbi:MAG: ABC transporter permease [Cyclobacteriaceae bacterium]|nr:ABC transporter permease [Cyclobacteriaceae bacterium]